MITLTHTVAGAECRINIPERHADLYGFEQFLAAGDKVLGLDTETTGLDIYSRGFRCRLVQFGNRDEAWVLRSDDFAPAIQRALRQGRQFVAHNWPYDALVIDRHMGVTVEELGPYVFDTRVLAHLLDPRMDSEGGIGLSLKPLSAVYVDPAAPDTQAGLTAEFRRLGLTKATGFAQIPIDNELYLRYAGLDTILVRRLFDEIAPMVRDIGLNHLFEFESHLQNLLATVQRRGIRLDVPYVERLRGELDVEAERFAAVAARYGVANVNSTKQLSEALTAMGEELTETTRSGAAKVDKEVLMPLADLNRDWERREARTPNPLADAVIRSKRAGKWSTTYAQAFLDLRDADDRLHPSIGALQARTARMSVSRPPLQQLPSSDWTIRRSFIADPGQVIIAADYQAVEMRVLAALADVPRMKEAIKRGEDIHTFTAAVMEGVTYAEFAARMAAGDPKALKVRKGAKGAGFGTVYGGGAATLARQIGVPMASAKEVIDAYAGIYPEIKRYSRKLINRAEYGKKEIITPSGRHLPLDRDRLYAATNYIVQSTSRDLLAQAIVDIHDAGLGDHLLMPVHDELVCQAPAADAEEIIHEIGRLMNSTFHGVPIESAPEVYGPSWGSGYKCPPELDAIAA